MKKILILAMAVAGLTLTTSVRADDAVMSPKAKEQADSLKTGPGNTPDMIDRSMQLGTPKSREMAYGLRTVPSTGPSIDLAHAPRPTLPAKDPQFDVAWRQNAEQQVQIAPLK